MEKKLDDIYAQIKGIADGSIGCNDAELESLAFNIESYFAENQRPPKIQLDTNVIKRRKGKSLTQQHIKRHSEKMKRFDKVMIWSNQWGAWWRQSGGYTDDIEQAGVFEIADAWKRSGHCGPEKRITYQEVL
ncbi:MAG: hypothetical protein GY820_38535 [Gammaproteobacteria bacterium]|nr:hypothetical protein [Gammaproteobacteria bacterium]